MAQGGPGRYRSDIKDMEPEHVKPYKRGPDRGPLRPPRMAELVAARLRQRIVSGDLDDGDELPREAELQQEFQVSRPSLREAIRILETEGLIRIRRGKVGGAIVKRPTPASAAYHLGLTLQSQEVTLEDLAAARSVLEPTCAGLAAAREDREHVVAELTRLVEECESRIDDSYEFTTSALEFHTAVVVLCGNATITALAGALEAVWGSQERLWAKQASTEGAYPDVKLRREALTAHRRIIRHIRDGDVDGATRAMRRHLVQSQPFVRYGQIPIEVIAPAV
jgi:GntR family transcriptional regulator, transcriptional repressor for pyruvate dehydrogenase complex